MDDTKKNKIDILYKQIDSLVEVVNGTNGDIKSIIDEDKTVPANVKNILYKKYNIVE